MKNLMPMLIIGILILGGVGAGALHKANDAKQKTMAVAFSQPVVLEKDQYVMVEIDGADSVLMRANKPMLPAYVHTFTFPFGTKINGVECMPSSVQQQYLSKKIIPSPEPVLVGQQIVQAEKTVSYGEDPYPNTWFEYDVGCGLNNNERCVFVKVQVFPVQYFPSEDLLKVAGDFQIDVEYEEPNQQTMTFDDEYDFIILAPSEFGSTLNALVTHKIGRGIFTKLVTLDEIYDGSYFPVNGRDNQEKIKYFIKSAIENWNTTNVLLVGGSDEFPVRMTHVYVNYGDGDAEVFVSDLYYADVYNDTFEFCSWDSNENDLFGEYDWDGSYDDVDFYPDVHLGRLACVDSNEVTTCVNKIINYETNEAYTQDWFTNLVVIGGDTSPNDDEDVLEGEYVNQAIIDIMDGFIPTKCWASEGTLSTKSFVNTAINEGAGFVDFSGHGNPSLWATHTHNNPDVWIPVGNYKNTHVSSLVNGDKLPIVVTGACSVGKFDSRSDCFTWSFISNPNGGGIAAVGPAALSWGYDTSYTIQALGGKMQLELFKAYKDEGAITFGEMWVRALNGYVSPGMDCGDYKTIEEWQPFGDPTLAIADESLPPEKPGIPDGNSSGGVNVEYTYTASTTDPNGDKLYYLFDWGDGNFSGWTGPYNSGEIAEMSHKWTEEGNYEIKVKAKDDHGVQSEWSDPLSVSMPKNKILINTPFIDFLENHPHIFPLLQRIFGL
jgi:hypothetical protein